MKFIPLADRVLVRVDDAETVTSGGIIIADTAKEEKSMGVIVHVGRGKLMENGRYHPMQVSVGNHVVFGKYAGDDILIDGVKHKLMKESELLAVQMED